MVQKIWAPLRKRIAPLGVPGWLWAWRKNKKLTHNVVHDDFLLNCIIGCKNDTADVALTASTFHMRFCRKILRATGGFDPE